MFAALGDETRLALLARLADGMPRSISELTSGSRLTRQAITKHLRVLENVGVVRHARRGRESQFAFDPQPLVGIQEYLEGVSTQWDEALSRLKSFVEAGRPGSRCFADANLGTLTSHSGGHFPADEPPDAKLMAVSLPPKSISLMVRELPAISMIT